MKNASPRVKLLADYVKLPFSVDTIELTFDLDDTNTTVTTKSTFNRSSSSFDESLILNGEELKLLSVSIDGTELTEDEYLRDDSSLKIYKTPETFTLEIKTAIDPKSNTSLDGLYKSGNIFCTQNEPEGFRRITYFLDRPDVMATYTTKIIADKKKYPVLLSNGNEVDKGDLDGGKHYVVWHDPFPKPCYLYALVGGDLGSITDTFTTCSGRTIDLRIYCDKGNESKCTHAMRSLKKSMKWDEEVFGLEYDLDIFMIVAVDAFNFGAMENKGLNIFNTSCALADDKTATDDNFYRVEGVIAHEYFHNWTGNRVTCRDWFQLTLKEGLTVFRDQEFSADMNSRGVKRIEDAAHLRSTQFAEDSGPMAHPIKPKSYIEINNFYTTTIYEKGAEIIRMIHTILGKDVFRKGIDKYFELYDGQAVTTDDFIYAMEQASGKDFQKFSHWYHQSGTPELHVQYSYSPEKKEFTLNLKQKVNATADQSEKRPLSFPFSIGLVGKNGSDIPLDENKSMLMVSKEQEQFVFKNINEEPVPSLNRNFSAPVKVYTPHTNEDLKFLMSHDSDEFNRWDSTQELATRLMLAMLTEGDTMHVDEGYVASFGEILKDGSLDYSFKALTLTLPSESSLGQRQEIINFDGNYRVRNFLIKKLAETYYSEFLALYEQLSNVVGFDVDPVSMGRRHLKNVCLKYLLATDNPEAVTLCYQQFQNATNMTDEFAALRMLANKDCKERNLALKAFYDKWSNDTLVMCKWFVIQSASSLEGALQNTRSLMDNSAFDISIPNIVRALLGGFLENHVQFHAENGEGYNFIADRIIQLNKINPHVAARLATSFRKYSKLDSIRKPLLKAAMDRILEVPGITPAVYEIVSKCAQ